MELKLQIRYLRSNFCTLMQILNSFYMQHIKYYADMQIYNTIQLCIYYRNYFIAHCLYSDDSNLILAPLVPE